MKIVHIYFTGPFNENMNYQENLLTKYHVKLGHEVVLLTTCFELNKSGSISYTKPVDKVLSNKVRLIRLNYSKVINNFITDKIRKVNDVNYLLENMMPDIIFIHGVQTMEVLTIAKYAKKNPRVNIFIDNHADYNNSLQNWFSKYILHKILWRYCAKRIEPYTQKFFGVTPLRCDLLRDVYKIPGEKIELLVMGVDDELIDFSQKDKIRKKIRRALNISDKDFVLIAGGKIDESKNLHLLMKAVDEMALENVRLILFGTPNHQMKAIIDVLSKSEYIINTGWIESERINGYLLASDLAVFPGTHSVLWEQSAGVGIPGVFKYWKGMDHIDVGGNCRYLYGDDVMEIKKVLGEIINNVDDYLKMKRVAESKGTKYFAYSEIARRSIQA